MKKIHNKLYLYIWLIISAIATYLSSTNKISDIGVFAMVVVALLFLLLAFKKPKESRDD
ncbi:hypothetical protein MgSA37_01167 [Mucilaginibacter gotjawali]|uniref:Ca2+/Na+ antiporter n=2 Tax=Mucilaginibacter gotjawali TaxID=1550579 RepID=A0A839SIK8_9SPHI|nr:Ca2+/Na+ antiporter [Mucilaginibacter gotjawali]BAU53000.1 hypothetical protein MgSA37_01167 [Mucilaginibacter gotjawali]